MVNDRFNYAMPFERLIELDFKYMKTENEKLGQLIVHSSHDDSKLCSKLLLIFVV